MCRTHFEVLWDETVQRFITGPHPFWALQKGSWWRESGWTKWRITDPKPPDLLCLMVQWKWDRRGVYRYRKETLVTERDFGGPRGPLLSVHAVKFQSSCMRLVVGEIQKVSLGKVIWNYWCGFGWMALGTALLVVWSLTLGRGLCIDLCHSENGGSATQKRFTSFLGIGHIRSRSFKRDSNPSPQLLAWVWEIFFPQRCKDWIKFSQNLFSAFRFRVDLLPA